MRNGHLLLLLALTGLAFGGWRVQQRPTAWVAEGVHAYAEQDFMTAADRFAAAATRSEDLRIQRDLALAALAADRLEEAAAAMDRLAQGSAEDGLWRAFLHGNLAWRRSEQAEVEAHGPVPPAGALERAIAYTEQARDAWKAVPESGSEAPTEGDSLAAKATRNVALAEARLARLRLELDAASGPDTEKVDDRQPQMQPMDPQQQQELMDQIERLDRQEMERRLEEMPEQGQGLDW